MKKFFETFPMKEPLNDWEKNGYKTAKFGFFCKDLNKLKIKCKNSDYFGECLDKFVEKTVESELWLENKLLQTKEELILEEYGSDALDNAEVEDFDLDEDNAISTFSDNVIMWNYGYEKYIVELEKSGDCD